VTVGRAGVDNEIAQRLFRAMVDRFFRNFPTDSGPPGVPISAGILGIFDILQG
jgi:hypothetical protein